MRPSRIVANIVGFMLFVQVILGGSAVLLGVPVFYHLVWGIITFAALIAATVLGLKDYGRKSNLFRVGVAATVIFVLQGILGLLSFNSTVAVLVHLTNAFVLAVLVTYFISFADSADKTMPKLVTPSTTASKPV